jgi:lysozyme family protein
VPKTVNEMLEELVGREGGYVNHPADRGGPTRWGITEQVARAYGYQGGMRELPRELALEIYRKRYWIAPGFQKVAEVMPTLAAELFDTGVNMGPAVPARFLQRALNGLNRSASDYPDIAADGLLGPMTLAAIAALRNKRGAMAETVLLRLVDSLQCARYLEVAEKRESQEAFLFGWVANRVGAPC